MAYTSKLRVPKWCQKRAPKLAVLEVTEGTGGNEINGATSATYKVVNLPPNALITNAYVHVKTVSDAATSSTVKLGTSDGGAEIMTAQSVKAATGKVGSLVGQILTGSGVAVYLTTAIVGASSHTGRYIVVIEYIELDQANGEYTSLTN